MSKDIFEERCLLCKNNHQRIFHKFDSFLKDENLDDSKIIDFISLVEKEILAKRWNAVNCMISLLIKSKKTPCSFIEMNFLTILLKLENCITCKPTLSFFKDMKNNLISQLLSFENESILVKNKVKSNSFNDEMDRLSTIIQKLGDDSTIDVQLKNYFVYRIIGFYEYKVFDTLKRQIDEKNPYKLTYGRIILNPGTTHTGYIEETIATILKHNSYKKTDFKIKCEPHFFDVFNKLVIFDSPLKESFERKFKSNFTYLIKNLLDSRNIMTHNMTDVGYTKEELNSIFSMMKVFYYLFPYIYKFVEYVILDQDESLKKHYIECNNTIKEELGCSMIPLNEVIDLIIEKFQKKTQSGTVKFYDRLKGFGFVKTDSGDEVYFNQDQLPEIVEEGDKLEFEIKLEYGKKSAICIEKIT